MEKSVKKPAGKLSRAVREARELQIEIIKQMVQLATSGFGVVAALAWNSVIQELVNNYIKQYLPQGSGLISLGLYALIVTILAVMVTVYLSRLISALESTQNLQK